MGRPRMKPTYCRNKGVRIRCTGNELDELKEKAAKRGMNVSEYIREVVGIGEESRYSDGQDS